MGCQHILIFIQRGQLFYQRLLLLCCHRLLIFWWVRVRRDFFWWWDSACFKVLVFNRRSDFSWRRRWIISILSRKKRANQLKWLSVYRYLSIFNSISHHWNPEIPNPFPWTNCLVICTVLRCCHRLSLSSSIFGWRWILQYLLFQMVAGFW